MWVEERGDFACSMRLHAEKITSQAEEREKIPVLLHRCAWDEPRQQRAQSGFAQAMLEVGEHGVADTRCRARRCGGVMSNADYRIRAESTTKLGVAQMTPTPSVSSTSGFSLAKSIRKFVLNQLRRH